MLKDITLVPINNPSNINAVIHSLMNNEEYKINRIETGIYKIQSFNFTYDFIDKHEDYFDFEKDYNYNAYGVADSLEQIKEHYKKWFEHPDYNFCVSITELKREDEPSEGGWRWHKWGPYIGIQNPECEYLYDEDDIDVIYVYHIFQLL